MGISKNRQSKFNLKLSWVVLANVAVILAIASPSLAESVTSLGRNFRNDPAKLTGEAGGSTSVASIAKVVDNCRGYANQKPNHIITLTESLPMLDFLVNSTNNNDDPTMLIKGPDGITACADDESRGRFPQVSLRGANGLLPKGNYEVWVGSKTANQSFSYTLYLSENRQ